MINSYVKGIFWVVGLCLAAMLLYTLFFVGDNSAVNTACRAVETPISKSYYDLALYPALHRTEGVAESLGYHIVGATSNFKYAPTDTASDVCDYTTDWM